MHLSWWVFERLSVDSDLHMHLSSVIEVNTEDLCLNIEIFSCYPIDRKFHGHGKNDGFVSY